MFLRAKTRIKDGKEHSYWSVVENRRVSGGKTLQRQVLYLGEIVSGQQAQWSRALEAFDEGTGRMRQIALFPEDRAAPEALPEAVQGAPEGFRAPPSAAMGRVLAGAGSVGAVATGRLLAGASAAEPERNLLAERFENARLLPAD
jgi:hypothetical protein